MKFSKILIFIMMIAMLAIGTGFAADNATFEPHNFDSHFTMKIPKGISFEKKEGMPTKNINFTVNYKNNTEKINIVYTESAGAKDNLLNYYEDLAKNDENISLKSYKNTTIIHFKDVNFIGEENYHDMAISGDDARYILMQCDNESLMKTMAESIKFK